MQQFFSRRNKIIIKVIVIFFAGYLLMYGGALVQTIFDIGKEVGNALAEWI